VTRSPPKRASPGSEPSRFRVNVSPAAQRAFEREIDAWELEHRVVSELRAEHEALIERLATFPLIGIRKRGRGHYRKVQLRITGFVVHYQVATRKRTVTILAIAAGPSLKHR